MYASTVRWSAPLGARVYASLSGPAGLKATGGSQTGGTLVASIQLHPIEPDGDATLRPGDVLLVRPEGGEPVTITVPSLAVDVDATSNRIIGVAPPAATLHAALGDGTDLGEVTVGSDGRFELDTSSQRDLARGDYGQILYTTREGYEFWARFAVFDVDAVVNFKGFRLHASVGSTITAEVAAPGQAASSTTVTPRPDWVASGNAQHLITGLPRVVPGAVITVTKVSPVAGMDEVVAETVPNLDLRIDRMTRIVRGVGPPRAPLAVDVGDAAAASGFRPSYHRDVVADDNGSFEFALADLPDLRPGWKARAAYDASPHVRFLTESVLQVVRVGLYSTQVDGVIHSGALVTVTLTSGDGVQKGQATVISNDAGKFAVGFAPVDGSKPDALHIEPGDVITLDEEVAGDPRGITVPRVTTVADAEVDSVSGEAPDGAMVRVTAGSDRIVRTVVSVGGHYAVEFGGEWNIEPGMSGSVIVTTGDGAEFHTGWATIQLTLNLEQGEGDDGLTTGGELSGSGTPGRGVEVTLLTPDGGRVSNYATRIPGEPLAQLGWLFGWGFRLLDSAGQYVHPTPGDTLRVVVGDVSTDFVIPRLEATTHVNLDQVVGWTEPHASVSCGIRRNGIAGSSDSKDTIADANGAFTLDFAGEFDLQYGDDVYVRLETPDHHTVKRRVRAAGLLVDLNDASVTGTVAPRANLVIDLMDGAGLRARDRLQATRDGTFVARFRTAEGSLVAPGPGDEISVANVDAGGQSDSITMIVPELTLQLHPEANVMRGTATPGGYLSLMAGALFVRQGSDAIEFHGSADPPIGRDGTYEVKGSDFSTPGGAVMIRLLPGLRIGAQYRMASGHLVRLWRAVPVVNVEHGGPHVCGFGTPGDTVAVELVDGSDVAVASTRGQVDQDGRFDLLLSDRAGAAVATASGETVRATLGDSHIDVALPTIVVTATWETTAPGSGTLQPISALAGVGPPLTRYYIATPAEACLPDSSTGAGYSYDGATDWHGRFDRRLDEQARGDGLQVAFFAPSGHRFYHEVIRPVIEAYVLADRVTGRAMPFGTASLELRDRMGREHGIGTASVGADGWFDARLKDASALAAMIDPEDVVTLRTGSETADMEVEALDFDFDATGGLIGRAPPEREIRMALRLQDGRQPRLAIVSDKSGRFLFGPDDIPVREGWRIADVREVRLVLPTSEGHATVAEAYLAYAEHPGVFSLHLPLVIRRN